MVFGKLGKIVVPPAGNGEQAGMVGRQLHEQKALAVGDEGVAIAVEDENWAVYFFDKLIGPDLVTQQPAERHPEEVVSDVVQKAVVGRVEDQHAWVIPGGEPCRNTAPERTPVEDDLFFRILAAQPSVYGLSVVEKGSFRTVARTFAEAPVIHHKKVVPFADEIAGKLAPALQTPAVALEVKNHSPRIGHLEMQGIDLTAVLHFEIHFDEGKGEAVFEGFRKDLRTEKEVVLKQVKDQAETCVGYCDNG